MMLLYYIPTEQEINDLIASCNKKTATLLQVLKETGARCGGARQLKWIDLNSESRTLSITPEKGSKPRQLKISNKLFPMLYSLPNGEPVIFKGTMKSFIRGFRRQRKKTAIKLKSD
jgi:integrase